MKKDAIRLAAIGAVLLVAVVVAATVYSRRQSEQRAAAGAAAVAAAAAQGTSAGTAPGANVALLERPHSRSLGPKDAKVTVVEFLDPECESCAAMYPLVKHLLAQQKDKVRLVIRYMPLHPNSMYAASALEAAGEQGKYWELLEALFKNHPAWASHHAPKPELIPEYARQVGLDMEAFTRTVNSTAHRTIVERDKEDGQKLGVNGTPTFFVNGRPLERLGYDTLQALINEELAKSR